MLSDRTDSRSIAPFTAYSTGRVTSISTCSGDRPGASVWMVTCGWTNSGNTSSCACDATQPPQPSSTSARASTTPRNRSESVTSFVSIDGYSSSPPPLAAFISSLRSDCAPTTTRRSSPFTPPFSPATNQPLSTGESSTTALQTNFSSSSCTQTHLRPSWRSTADRG